ncbi:B-cell antigen receptor complex-associated protein alpha chain [Mustelus asterias]
MASRTVQARVAWLLLMTVVTDVGTLKIMNPTVRAEVGYPFQLECDLSPKDGVTWQMRRYNNSDWQSLSFGDTVYSWTKVGEENMGIYRCRIEATNNTSCDIGLRLYRSPEKFFNIRESVKNIILMVEGILLLSLVVIPGSILLREKSQKSLQERIQRYKEENANLYEGLNQADQSTYEDITRGQQCMYQDVANYRLSDYQLEQP